MSKWVLGAIVCAVALTALTIFASRKGWGVPQPTKEPLSIREESARGVPAQSGRYRTRYFFMGGGPARGK